MLHIRRQGLSHEEANEQWDTGKANLEIQRKDSGLGLRLAVEGYHTTVATRGRRLRRGVLS